MWTWSLMLYFIHRSSRGDPCSMWCYPNIWWLWFGLWIYVESSIMGQETTLMFCQHVQHVWQKWTGTTAPIFPRIWCVRSACVVLCVVVRMHGSCLVKIFVRTWYVVVLLYGMKISLISWNQHKSSIVIVRFLKKARNYKSALGHDELLISVTT